MTDQPTPTSPVETPELDPTVATPTEPVTQSPEPVPQPRPEDTAEHWKKRHAESSREAQLLIEQNKLKDAQIKQLTQPHNPTDAELMAAYPEWESMMPSEQRLARENFSLKQGLANTQQRQAEIEAEVRWNKDVKKLITKDEFKAHSERLKSEAFEDYVFTPQHKGIPLDILAKSFLHGTTPAAPSPAVPTPSPTAERGKPNANPAANPTKKLTAAEGAILRKENFEEWRKQVKAGNIETDVD